MSQPRRRTPRPARSSSLTHDAQSPGDGVRHPATPLRVTVVGGGVIGLTCAHELARAGCTVRVVSADPPERTTSAVAAAIWFPYRAAPAGAVLRWSAAALSTFSPLAADPATGVALRCGTFVHRLPDPDLAWTATVADARPAAPSELPPGAPAGTRCTVPVVDMGRYLRWLAAACSASAVDFVSGRVAELADVPGDVVVLAGGLASGALLGDDSGVPVQGQVVRLANPGLTDWLIDEDHPGGLTYVVPRADDVVCGGTDVEGADCTEPDPEVERAILDRALALVPALRGAPVLSRAVGLRPGRPAVRLERLDVAGRPVIACYGHGGAGVTMSWGCAADVVRLALG